MRLLAASLVHFGQCVQAAVMYRSSLAIFLATESVAYAGFIAFWYKAAESNTAQTIYTGLSLAAYFVLVSFHHSVQDHGASRDIGTEIRLGKLSYSLIRPYPYLWSVMVRMTAYTMTKSAMLLPLFAVIFIFVPNLWGSFAGSLSGLGIMQYVLASIVAILASMLSRLIVGMMAFHMSQIWAPDTMFIAVYYATSGSVFPMDLAPSWLYNLSTYSPAYYMTGFPVLVLMGRVENYAEQLTRGVMVCLVASILAAFMWTRGTRKFEAIGI